jgi:predicted MPP superfamily phosphohydrolase
VRALWWEPRQLRVRELDLAPAHWPAELDGLRVGVVSDLHAGAPHIRATTVERVADRLAERRPDLIALLGDYVDPAVRGGEPVAPEAVAQALAGLRAPLGVLAVLGNHDWANAGERMPRALEAAGITVLEDAARELRPGLWAVGLGDARTRDPDPAAALSAVPPDAAVIVLAHDPDVFPRIPARASLTLSGHTHGGQVDLPLLRRRVIPSRYGDRYAAGHVVEDGRHLFVTRGVGTSGWPVRLRSVPEVVILRLVTPSAGARTPA